MAKFYLASADGFYEEQVEGAVEITDEQWGELLNEQITGAKISADENGYPVAIPRVKDPVAESEQLKSELVALANIVTADWRTELALGIIDDDDKVKLTAWMKYIKAVKAVDTSTAPDVSWPEKPAV